MLTRRRFLLTAGAGLALAACGGTAAPASPASSSASAASPAASKPAAGAPKLTAEQFVDTRVLAQLGKG